jgi:hypothetical protein
MTFERGEPYFRLDQFIGYQLYQDWMFDFDGVYEAAEEWITSVTDPELRGLVDDIDLLFRSVPDATERRKMFRTHYAFDDNETFDVWLRAVRERAAEAVAGIHNHPLVDPPA